MSEIPEELRPRFGKVVRADGTETPIYYHPFEGEGDAFLALDPKTDQPVKLHPGDTIHFDKIGSHQTIMVERPNGAPRRGKTPEGWSQDDMKRKIKKEIDMENNQKDPNGWIKGLATLFVLGGFVLGMVWGINAILGG